MRRLPNAALLTGFLALALIGAVSSKGVSATWPADPPVTLLDLHPADMGASSDSGTAMMMAMPRVVTQGAARPSGSSQVQVPMVVTPSQPIGGAEDPAATGRAGTGFFIGGDGALLTAAHVVKDCARLQIISKYVPRAWASVLGTDDDNDVAVLKASVRPPAIARIASTPPASERLFMLGYPEAAGLTVPAEAWGVIENQKFPGGLGPLTDPRDVLWMSAPAVTHGYSGGPIFDPKLGAVVGIIKGEVDGGYLRLVPNMPTAGIAIGPGVTVIGDLVRHEVSYGEISLVSLPGDAGQDALRHATVHVLCWR
jgi:S1-C subfamily serine protease